MKLNHCVIVYKAKSEVNGNYYIKIKKWYCG